MIQRKHWNGDVLSTSRSLATNRKKNIVKYETITLDKAGERTGDTPPRFSQSIEEATHTHHVFQSSLKALEESQTILEALLRHGFVVTPTSHHEHAFIVTILVRAPSLADAMKDKEVK